MFRHYNGQRREPGDRWQLRHGIHSSAFDRSRGLNLGPLANNGRPTETHALGSGSAAIGAVTDCTDLRSPAPQQVTADQRGVTRPQGTLCDVGAFEAGSITIIKDAVPNDAQDFSFSGDLGMFSLDDDSDATLPNQTTFSNLAPGSYRVTEDSVSGWALTNLDCTDPDNGGPDDTHGDE